MSQDSPRRMKIERLFSGENLSGRGLLLPPLLSGEGVQRHPSTSVWLYLGLEQVSDPHNRHRGPRVRGPFRCGALGTGPDIVLLGHKVLAVLRHFKLALGDVSEHGI